MLLSNLWCHFDQRHGSSRESGRQPRIRSQWWRKACSCRQLEDWTSKWLQQFKSAWLTILFLAKRRPKKTESNKQTVPFFFCHSLISLFVGVWSPPRSRNPPFGPPTRPGGCTRAAPGTCNLKPSPRTDGESLWIYLYLFYVSLIIFITFYNSYIYNRLIYCSTIYRMWICKILQALLCTMKSMWYKMMCICLYLYTKVIVVVAKEIEVSCCLVVGAESMSPSGTARFISTTLVSPTMLQACGVSDCILTKAIECNAISIE